MITGGNAGIGLETAKALSHAGARTIVACRNTEKAADATASFPSPVIIRRLDLGDLSSVREFATTIDHPVDVLINNAGVSLVGAGQTADGFETHFGVNHLGHFALTGQLLDRITDRVVTVSSGSHRQGRIRKSTVRSPESLRRWAAYAQSKLANLLFAYELQSRFAAAGSHKRSVASHPGVASTGILAHNQGRMAAALRRAVPMLGQPADMGALTTLYAATVHGLSGGEFVGPGGFAEMTGYPRRVSPAKKALDRDLQRSLWQLSEQLTGVRYEISGLDEEGPANSPRSSH